MAKCALNFTVLSSLTSEI